MSRTTTIRPFRRRSVALGVAALAVSLVVPLAPSPAEGSLSEVPTFTDDDGDGLVTLADSPSPISYLGAGEEGLSYVAESTAAALGAAYGFDPERADTSLYAGASPYVRSVGRGNDVLASDAADFGTDGDVTGTYTVQVSRTVPVSGTAGPWKAHAFGPQSGGFFRPAGTWTFDPGATTGATDTSIPGEPVGVVMVGSDGPVVVFATTAGVYAYELMIDPTLCADCLDARLVGQMEVGPGRLDQPPAAVASVRELGDGDGDGTTGDGALEAPTRSMRFVVATRRPSGTAGIDAVDDLLLFEPSLPDPTSGTVATLAPTFGMTWLSDQQFPSSARVSVRAGSIVPIPDTYLSSPSQPYGPNQEDVLAAVHAGDDWSVYRYFRDGFLQDTTHSCPSTTAPGAYDAPGFDFATTNVPERQDDFALTEYSTSAYAGVCAVPSDASESSLLVGAAVGPGVDVELHQPWDDPIASGVPPTYHTLQTHDAQVREVEPATGTAFTDPQVHVSFPCFEVGRILGAPQDESVPDPCNDADLGKLHEIAATVPPGLMGVTVLAGVDTSLFDGRERRPLADHTALLGVRPFAEPDDGEDWDQAWVRELPDHAGNLRSMVRAPNIPVRTTVDLDDDACILDEPEDPRPAGCTPSIALGNPMPVAILAAPPKVAGAGQSPAIPPTFAKSASVGSAEDVLSAARVSASVGMEYEDPGGAFGVEFEITYQQEVEQTVSTTLETTQGQAFFGSPDTDVVVYNATSMWEFPGTVVESSTGLGLGTQTTIRHPRSNVMGSASFEFLETQYPDLFGEFAPFGNALRQTLSHTPGDPGSYMPFGPGSPDEGASVDGYCEGSIDGSEPVPTSNPAVSINPFRWNPPPTPDNAILVSDPFQVVAGTSNSEAATVELSDGSEESYLRSHSIDAEVGGKYGYVTGSVGAGGTWGSGWTYSVSESTAFEAAVGHIPFAELQDETYEWRMFLCKRDVGSSTLGGRMPVWVLGYTVDEYTGSGGLSLGPVEAVSPTGADIVDPADPSLVWRQDDGTIRQFDWELEAIGADDTRAGVYPENPDPDPDGYLTMEDGRDPGLVELDLGTLLPDQLYRWRVTATDFFGNSTQSEHQFFATSGPPDAAFTYAPTAPVVGEQVTLTAAAPTADGTTFGWDLDGTTATGRVITHAFGDPGPHDVSLAVTTSGGTATSTQAVPVRATIDDDLFVVDEDGFLDVAGPGVLANDDGADRATLDGDARLGDVRLAVDGGFSYRPDRDVCGTDGFGYRASGGGLETDETAMVVLGVTCVNDAPVAVDDPDWGAVEDTPLVVGAPGVLANDTDVDSPTLTANLLASPANGAVSLAPDGAWTYVPHLDACGPDAFTYEASDGDLTSAPATVTIDVECVAEPPVAPGELPVDGLEDEDVTGTLPGSDPDGPVTGFEGVGEPEHGTVVVRQDGTFTFTPDPDFCGTASFRYRVTDDAFIGPEVLVRIEIACVDDLPDPQVVSGPIVVVDGGPTVVDLAPGTLHVAVTHVSEPRIGTTEVAGSSVTYTPLPGECGSDGFTYTLTAPDGSTATYDAVVDVPCEQMVDPVLLRVLGGHLAIGEEVTDDVESATSRLTHRLAGADRYATSAEVAREAWPSGADTVLVATGANFPDGLAAGAAAAQFDAPMVLTPGSDLPGITEEVLAELGPDRIVVLGGAAAVSADVLDAIEAATGVVPERIGGGDRYETSALVAAHAWPGGSDVVYVATGETFPDALAGAAAAGMHGAPVLLTPSAGLAPVTADTLVDLAPQRIVVLGGAQALHEVVEDEISALTGIQPDRLQGTDRYATASAIARDAWPAGTRSAYLATGEDFADALSGAAAAGRRQVPVLLVRPHAVPPATRTTLQRLLE